MKERLHLIILVVLTLFAFTTYGQGDYIATDTTIKANVNLMSSNEVNNAQYIEVLERGKIIRYYPDDLVGYGFLRGKTYVSRKITLNGREVQVFLEELFKGKYKLYYYPEQKMTYYFIETQDSALIKLTRDDFRDVIQQNFKDCPSLTFQLPYLKYKSIALVKFLKEYELCRNRAIPSPRYGISLGYGITKLPTSRILNASLNLTQDVEFDASGGMHFGAFAMFPIRASDFGLGLGAYFSSSGFEKQAGGATFDIELNSLTIPITGVYTIPMPKYQPMLFFGVALEQQLSNTSEASRGGMVVEDQLMDNTLAGITGGIGLNIRTKSRKSISFEFRYDYFPASVRIDKQNILVTSSFSF